MKQESREHACCQEKVRIKHHHHSGGSGAIYSMGVIGALFYFLQNAVGFSAVMVGIGKAIFWPAVLIFHLLSQMQL